MPKAQDPKAFKKKKKEKKKQELVGYVSQRRGLRHSFR
jgi:ABC-type Mn2+/Zn2+ transport system ATPase subunit